MVSVVSRPRSSGATWPGRSATISGASASGRSRSRWFSVARSSNTSASSATGAGSSTTRCSTRPVSVISTSISRVVDTATSSRCRTRLRDSDGYCTTATLRVSWASARTARCSTSSRSTAPSRKASDGPPLGRRQRLDLGEPVDEEPVAGVGGHPAGAGVRLGDQPLLLERGHVVADRRRRDAEVVPVDQRLAADRLVGGDEVLDDRPQHLELAVLDGHGDHPSHRFGSSLVRDRSRRRCVGR